MDRMIMNPKWSTFPNCGKDLRDDYCSLDSIRYPLRKSSQWEAYESMCEGHLLKREGPSCSICKGDVQNEFGARGRYGLLQGCDHVFCLPCIREVAQTHLSRIRKYWKTIEIVGPQIQCPVCKCPSLYIMSTKTFIKDPEQKKRFVSQFIYSGRLIPCEFLRCGFGICFCIDRVNHDGKSSVV